MGDDLDSLIPRDMLPFGIGTVTPWYPKWNKRWWEDSIYDKNFEDTIVGKRFLPSSEFDDLLKLYEKLDQWRKDYFSNDFQRFSKSINNSTSSSDTIYVAPDIHYGSDYSSYSTAVDFSEVLQKALQDFRLHTYILHLDKIGSEEECELKYYFEDKNISEIIEGTYDIKDFLMRGKPRLFFTTQEELISFKEIFESTLREFSKKFKELLDNQCPF